MKISKLIVKNVFRRKLRTVLTILGVAIAVAAFGMLRTIVSIWDVATQVSSPDRLIVRDAVSFINPLPYAYLDKIRQVPGVKVVTFANWFGGIYKNKKNFFARSAVDGATFFQVYPRYRADSREMADFMKERDACIVGSALAKRYGFKLGDTITLKGDIYPGIWDFVVRGIYRPKSKSTDAAQMFFHWKYLNEKVRQEFPGREDEVGWYIARIDDPANAGTIAGDIDALFKNSSAETKTESERNFVKGFISSESAIFTVMDYMSYVIVGIIMLVLANTMIMAARERTREYAVLKAIGFSARHLTELILGESLAISVIGGAIGVALTFPLVRSFQSMLPPGAFPGLNVGAPTLLLASAAVVMVGIGAAAFPIQRVLATRIADGVRFAG